MNKCGLLKILLSVLACALLMCLLSCGKEGKDQGRVIASIDDFKITFQDLSDQFKRTRGDSALEKADIAARRIVLDEMIKEQVTLLEAYRLGINKDEKVLAVAREKERELASKALRKQEVDDRIISEELLRRYYQWSDRELQLLYMKFFAGNTAHGIGAAQQKADKIYQQLLSGASFKALASLYSEHGSAKTDSGKIGQVPWYGTQEAFFEHGYPLPEGGVSKPFLDNNSVWIVKVEKSHPVPRDSYEKARAEILEKAQEICENQIAKRNMEFSKTLRSEYHFALNPEKIDFFCQRCKSMKTLADSAALFSPLERGQELCKTDVEATTIGAFFPKVVPYYWNSLDQKRVVEMLLTELNTSRLMKHKAMQMRVNEMPEVKREYQSWLVYYLKKMVVQREVIDKIDISESVLRPIYEQKQATFVVKKQATVREIFRKTKAGIDHVHQLALAGNDFAALQKKYCQNLENKNSGIVGPFPVGMNGKLGELAFSGMRIGEISRPFRYRGGYSVIQLLALAPEKVKTFDAAKEEIKADYLQTHWQQKTSEWLDQARRNYKIRSSL
jgi:parvulin-like peptidyl-prolyl isomerase